MYSYCFDSISVKKFAHVYETHYSLVNLSNIDVIDTGGIHVKGKILFIMKILSKSFLIVAVVVL